MEIIKNDKYCNCLNCHESNIDECVTINIGKKENITSNIVLCKKCLKELFNLVMFVK